MKYIEEIPEKAPYDLIVCGGGVAGAAAALAARRAGCSVLLAEKGTILGGLATAGLINLFVPLCNGRGQQIVNGLAEEFLRLAIRHGYDTLPEIWRNGEPAEATAERCMTAFSPCIFALALTELLAAAGVELLFDAVAAEPVMSGTHCDGVIFQTKAGREFRRAGIVIDATGDADLLVRAGVPVVRGRNFFTYFGRRITLESCRHAAETGDIGKAFLGIAASNADLYGNRQPDGVEKITGTEPEEISSYLTANHRRMLAELRRSGRRERDVIGLPTVPQFRTTRRIDGEYTLSETDLYRHFPDSVGTVCDFERCDRLFEVPYRTLMRSPYDNLLTCGRSAAGIDYLWDILRVIPAAILTGQAAGTAAALALETGGNLLAPELPKLQRRLAATGVMIHFPDSLVPAQPAEEPPRTVELG